MPTQVKRQGITRELSELDPGERALHQLLVRAFGRAPADLEMARWMEKLNQGISARDFLAQLSVSRPFTGNAQVGSKTPAGHFYSPVVDPETVRDYVAARRAAGLAGVQGIDFPLEAMAAFWQENAAFIAAAPFNDEPDGTHRYSYGTGPYPYGDGVVLRTMIHHHKPKRIVEIGSGFSTACMLDTADELGRADLDLTCIEPNPERLFSLLRPEDPARMTIHRKGVQEIPLDVFRALERNDILFIDSSHVLKTGSDVHYELFSILPCLAPGVIVHFHDCRFPFEYSDRQIFVKNYSWNEVYAVRALLMYSTRFKVIFYNSLFDAIYPALGAISPPFKRNPGGAIWIRVQE
jgi:predicted O-methyltransferase YrrM